MNSPRLRIVLASDSLDPSGLGEHMLTLGRALKGMFDITLALPDSSSNDFLVRAARAGLAIKTIGDRDDFEHWLRLKRVSLLHVHAGIGWEGHDIARAGVACGMPVIRTEHLPYLLTDTVQTEQYHREVETVSHHIVVSEASRASFEDNGVEIGRAHV